MVITVNGKEIGIVATTVTEALLELNVRSPDQVAVELNGEVLDRTAYGHTTLKQGDQLEFLYFMGGGRGAYRHSD